jgi:hypothetical protein
VRAEIIISPNGEVAVVTREGTFQEGAARISAFLDALRARGVEVAETKFEQHRHDEEKVSLGQGVRPRA